MWNSLCITSSADSALNPPEPEPMIGKATVEKSCFCAIAIAFCTDARMEYSEARHSMLIPATWIMPLNGSLPAPVSTAPPSGIAPFLPSSRNGAIPPRRLIAPETPCGSRNHQGIMFLFHELTIASTSWSRRSPFTIRTSI